MDGFRVSWTHESGDVFVGELWPDRETADAVAAIIRAHESCREVRVRPSSERPIPPGAEGALDALMRRAPMWSRARCINAILEWPSWAFGGDAGSAGELLEDLVDAVDQSDALLVALPDELRERLEDWRRNVAPSVTGEQG